MIPELHDVAKSDRNADPKFTRAMVALIPFATEFARRGGDVDLVLTNHRIPTGALSEPMMLVEANACYAAMEDMANLLGDPCFGARLAIEAGNTGTPAIRYAAAQAGTFGDFLSRFTVEFAKQLDNVEHRVEISPRAASFELRRRMTPRGATTQVHAVNIAFFVTLFKRGLGEVFDPARVTVFAPDTEGVPADFLPKRSLLRSRMNGIRIVFPPEWLWAPFFLGWTIGETGHREFGGDEDHGILVHFRSVMEENIDQGDLTLSRFADLVGLHPRRVQRILAAHRTSFQQLKGDVRQGLALDLLANTGMPVADIASRVGFSSASTFDRAFRERTGTTPTRFRGPGGPEGEG